MKSKTLITLYTIVAILAVGVVIAKLGQSKQTDSSTKFTRGEKPLATLNPSEISEISIEDSETTTTVKIDGGKWVVVERGNYEAKTDALRDLIRQVLELSVAQSMEAGPSFDPRFGMDERASLAENHGEIVTFKSKDGTVLTRIKFGKEIAGQSQANQANPFGGGAQGRFVRFAEDEKSIYVVSDGMSSVDANPKNWLKEDFLEVRGITSITMSPAGAPDQVEWKVSREDMKNGFTLSDIPEGKVANEALLSSIQNVLSYGNFEDVVTAKAAEGLLEKETARKATIETNDGFTYTINLFPKSAEGTKNYLMTFSVAEQFTKEFQPKEESTEEEQKSAKADFQANLNTLQKQFADLKALEGVYYEVASWVLDPIAKSKSDLLQDESSEEGAEAEAAQGAVPNIGAGSQRTPYSVTTPPLPVRGQ